VSEPGHLLPAQIEGLVLRLSVRQQLFLLHLTECPICQLWTHDFLAPSQVPEASTVRPPADYSQVWGRLAAAREEAVERVASERQQAEGAVAALLALPFEERCPAIREEARFRTVPVAWLLLERGSAAAKAQEAEDLTLLGIFTLGQIGHEHAPPSLLAELKARGWALVAKGSWARGDWPATREALERADEALRGVGYVAKAPGIRRAVAATRLTERAVEQLFALTQTAVQLLLQALLGERPAPAAATPETSNDKGN
jgi:hypothetical protein